MNAPAPAAVPLRPRARFDLHLHSDLSDGTLPPAEVLRRCAEGGLDVIALTDHDIGPALPHGPHRVGGRTIHLVHATEVSGVHEGRELHLLVYFPGEMPAPYRERLRTHSALRATRYAAAVARLGLPGLAPPPAAAMAGERALTRVHLSRAIVDAGHAADMGDAFRRYTGSHLGRVPLVELGFLDAIAEARAAGGLCSWAHPPLEAVEAWLATFARAGLHALEAARPSLAAIDRNRLLRAAHKHGLLVTGGSDNHCFPGSRGLGSWSFPAREARPVARALGFAL